MLHSLPFFGTVTAGNRITMVSQKIAFPYILDQIRLKYALGHNGLVQHSIFVSRDAEAPTTGEPTGRNVLLQYGSVGYVCGDDDVEVISDQTIVDEMPTWIKIHVYNTDAFDHTANVLITIDDRRPNPQMTHVLELLEKLMGAQVPRA